MKEMGGFIEYETHRLPMLHDNSIKLNCGRNALAYIIEGKNIRTIYMPRFMCLSCNDILKKYNVQVQYYSIGVDFKPENIDRAKDEWLFVVNYYGQLSNDYLKSLGDKIIVDNSQAYFQKPIEGIDTFYNCRKFFGVPDGAILFSDCRIDGLKQDVSFQRMKHLLGRFERPASECYENYLENEKVFEKKPIMQMSKLTENLLHGIDYSFVKQRRTDNFTILHNQLKNYNMLGLKIPGGAFMYPLYINDGGVIREKLRKKKIYIPTLWPDVFKMCKPNDLEYKMAENILPLPVDQRYNSDDMMTLSKELVECMGQTV